VKKKLKVGLIGSTGRMGQEIEKILGGSKTSELFYAPLRREKFNEKKAAQVDVWIDFSQPEAFADNLKMAEKFKAPFVCGTTGFTPKEKALLKKYAAKMPLLWSSNMSLGVAVLNEALKSFSAIPHFDFQIEEIHHNKKKDKPSGTAITLQENLNAVIGKEAPAPLAIRGGGVFGVHKIFALSDEEVITFEHQALNRTVFARGAVTAAEWLANKKPGLYQMRDVLFG
jgi:4-hydroxy-tetrahydrodipicolinate reductase